MTISSDISFLVTAVRPAGGRHAWYVASYSPTMTSPIQGLRAGVSRYRQAHDAPELASLRSLVRSLTDGPAPDVLFFGDSLTLFRAPYDADPTFLPEMVFA